MGRGRSIRMPNSHCCYFSGFNPFGIIRFTTALQTRGWVISPQLRAIQERRLVRGQSMRKRRPFTGAQTRCLGGVFRA
jgi:hypothetical protein